MLRPNGPQQPREAEKADIVLLRKHPRTGHPCGDMPFVERIEKLVGRTLRPQKRDPKPKQKKGRQFWYLSP